jgi:hypothetical protein
MTKAIRQDINAGRIIPEENVNLDIEEIDKE